MFTLWYLDVKVYNSPYLNSLTFSVRTYQSKDNIVVTDLFTPQTQNFEKYKLIIFE